MQMRKQEKQLIEMSILIPCCNEEAALPIFYREVTGALLKMEISYELIFINDGSYDKTLDKLRNLAAKDVYVKYISFSRNFGKEAAMYAGFCNAKGKYVAVMDCDMQDPPSLLPQMYAILEKGEYDSVATRRTSRTGEPPIRSWFDAPFSATGIRLRIAPPSIAATICGRQIVPLKRPRYVPIWPLPSSALVRRVNG